MTLPLLPRSRSEVVPGAVHVPDWLSVQEQVELVAACRQWARPPAPMHSTRLPNGGMMSVKTVCLGWHWLPYRYSRFAEDVDGAPVTAFPSWLGDLAKRAVAEVGATAPVTVIESGETVPYEPDIALVNLYEPGAKMGMHRDVDEQCDAPVVSLSLGDSCTFRFGNTANRNRPYHDIELHSGDLFVFSGPARFAYHGVTKTVPGTSHPALPTARLNLTIRQR